MDHGLSSSKSNALMKRIRILINKVMQFVCNYEINGMKGIALHYRIM